MTETLEKLAKKLEAHEDYKVLRRLKGLEPKLAQEGQKLFSGRYVDVESTGLDTERDEVIELAIHPFNFTADGTICGIGKPYHGFQEPNKPLTDIVKKVTGLTDEILKDQKILIVDVEANMKGAELVIAHHAAFDRLMLERLSDKFKSVCWGCSMSQVPWADFGIEGKKLTFVLNGLGYFYDAHRATVDCEAGIFALGAALPSGKTALSYVLEAGRKTSFHVWAVGAKFEFNDGIKPGDLMKARGYFWSPGENGKRKAWHKEIGADEREAEEAWLAQNVFRSLTCPSSVVFDKVTAFDRFSKRG